MASILATESCYCQQLIRVTQQIKVQPMVADTKADFARRLNEACDKAYPPIPPGRGRRAELRRRVKDHGIDLSGEAVRKWLSADSIPSMDNVRILAKALGVNTEWLLTGRPSSPTTTTQEPAPVVYGRFNATIGQVIEIMERLENNEQQQILGLAKSLDIARQQENENSILRAGS